MDAKDAMVVCRELGYKYAVRALDDVHPGDGQIWLDEVKCDGTEQSLSSCSHNGWGNQNCGHNEDAGVECSSIGTIIIVFSIAIG